jgi:hypothetical protein
MKFISLIDTKSGNIITIDASSLLLRLEIDEHKKECRLKPFMGDILYALFKAHPAHLSYEVITAILKTHHLVITDDTRMHRKLSEIRNFLDSFHSSLTDLIRNIRGIGYCLPLTIKNIDSLKTDHLIKFKSPEITKQMQLIKLLIDDAIIMIAENKIIKQELGYVINRTDIKELLTEKIATFNMSEKIILEQINLHEAEFNYSKLTL